jgi:hypothetical protein
MAGWIEVVVDHGVLEVALGFGPEPDFLRK